MSAFPVLGGIEALTILRDSNAPGLAAALRCRDRWRDAGREVRILAPSAGCADFAEEAEQTLSRSTDDEA
jgi:hypothetical protein